MDQGAKVQSQTLRVKDLGTAREGTMGADEREFLGSWSWCLDSFLLSPSRQPLEGGWFIVREWDEEWC